MWFRGHSNRNLDSKGRLMLPPEFRQIVVDDDSRSRCMITNFDGCVACYTMSEWERIESSFYQLNQTHKSVRAFQRFFIAGAVEASLDKQGRMLVPPHLRSYAKLEKEVILAGVGRKFEIWNQALFEQNRQALEENYEQIMSDLQEQGFELRI
ncbi:MAG: division/cell wall cluster transcriptional repressor MraZ [Desulfohalobiaceae bacterium]|nr:division/cell wall cluster transcriptional repressor MraZ [Desulfohalobiaceae bacterium]